MRTSLFCGCSDFYPRSPCGERLPLVDGLGYIAHISIHALLAESDRQSDRIGESHQHFYPRSPCGERPRAIAIVETATEISIHALLAESDGRAGRTPARLPDFYPRSPCGERPWRTGRARCLAHFYPRSPCGERQSVQQGLGKSLDISIHALLAESDMLGKTSLVTQRLFLSTLSLRRATA